MSHRSTVVQAVFNAPGIGFAQLQEETGLANGVLQHHLRSSDRVEQVNGAYLPAGFCQQCALQEKCGRTCLRKLLRDPVKREIVERLAASESQAAIAAELGKHRSTVHYHVQRLTDAGVLADGEPVGSVRTLLDV